MLAKVQNHLQASAEIGQRKKRCERDSSSLRQKGHTEAKEKAVRFAHIEVGRLASYCGTIKKKCIAAPETVKKRKRERELKISTLSISTFCRRIITIAMKWHK